MSFIPAFQYVIGLGVFGFMGWVLNGVKAALVDVGIHETGDVWTFLNYIWWAMFIVYLVFGGIWVIRKYTEKEYIGGM